MSRTDPEAETAVATDYVERVNRAIDHIVCNLGQTLRLDEVSAAAGFSPFHFHRTFKALLGETLNQFVKRQRLERALYLMSHAPKRSRTVAYIRVLDPYRKGVAQAACERLLAWATERGLAEGQWLGYMWEEPEIVALADCRYDVALVVDDVEPAGEVGRFDLPPMRVAEVVLSGDIALEVRALDWLYKTWLPRSACVPDDQPAFEAWLGRQSAHGDAFFEIACQLPVKSA